jgi:tellurite resistance protein TerC
VRDEFVSIDVPPWAWVALIGVIVVLLVADLLIVHRRPHAIGFREAAIESSVWIALGLSFTVVVAVAWGGAAAGEYLAGYAIEKSLSVDNVFVWAVLFTFFAVPAKHQHRVLFWGIFGAIVFRMAFIFAGVALLESLTWIVYVFGAFLLYTAYKLFTSEGIEVDPEHNPVLVRIRKLLPQTEDYHGERFFVRVDGKRMVTPMLTVLISIEFTDILFAVDSIPAILAITRDEFLVFSSNAFAILGLRALYFLFAGLQDRFVYLDKGLGIILAFVGLKFIGEGLGLHIPTLASLGFIAVVLTLTFWLSLRHAPDGTTDEGSDAVSDVEHSTGSDATTV